MVVPDVAVAEAMNAFYVQEHVLHVIEDGRPYVERMFKGVEAGSIEVVRCSKDVALKAYEISVRSGTAVYDSIFVSLALKLGAELKTLDVMQEETMASERAKAAPR